MQMIFANDMQLRDRVLMGNKESDISPYMCFTVIGVSNNYILLYRPYISVADFETVWTDGGEGGSQTIAYIGTETIKIERNSHVPFLLLERG